MVESGKIYRISSDNPATDFFNLNDHTSVIWMTTIFPKLNKHIVSESWKIRIIELWYIIHIKIMMIPKISPDLNCVWNRRFFELLIGFRIKITRGRMYLWMVYDDPSQQRGANGSGARGQKGVHLSIDNPLTKLYGVTCSHRSFFFDSVVTGQSSKSSDPSLGITLWHTLLKELDHVVRVLGEHSVTEVLKGLRSKKESSLQLRKKMVNTFF